MKKSIVYSLVLFFACSCMTTNRMNKLVTKHYTNKHKTILSPSPNPFIELNYDKLKRVNGYCNSKYNAFFTVPLIFYTFSKEKIACEINPKLVGWGLQKQFIDWFNTVEGQNTIGSNVLEISFIKLPNFVHHKYVSHTFPMTNSQANNFTITNAEFKSEGGVVEVICYLRNSQGDLIKQIELSKELKPVVIQTYFERPRKHFIFNGLFNYDSECDATFRELLLNIIEEL